MFSQAMRLLRPVGFFLITLSLVAIAVMGVLLLAHVRERDRLSAEIAERHQKAAASIDRTGSRAERTCFVALEAEQKMDSATNDLLERTGDVMLGTPGLGFLGLAFLILRSFFKQDARRSSKDGA